MDDLELQALKLARTALPDKYRDNISDYELKPIAQQVKHFLVWAEENLGYNPENAKRRFHERAKAELEKLVNLKLMTLKKREAFKRKVAEESWRLFTRNFQPYIETGRENIKLSWSSKFKDKLLGISSPTIIQLAREQLNIADEKSLTRPEAFIEELFRRLNGQTIKYVIDRRQYKSDIPDSDRFFERIITIRPKFKV